MVSRYIEKYSNIIANELSPIYVRFPQTENEIATTKRLFLEMYGFPGIVGIIDGTHIHLSAVLSQIENAYVNRKMRHSINALIVCDANMTITYANARCPGSFHDSFVFNGSQLSTFLENNHVLHPHEWTWVLGNLFADKNWKFFKSNKCR